MILDSHSADLFLPYLTAPAVEWARSESTAPVGPRWESVPGSMVFGDISGFTKMSERLARHGKVGAEEVADGINTCFDQLLGVAYRCGGSLLKFGGDALLLLFRGPQHELKAAHAALGMRKQLKETGRLQTTAGQVNLSISIGAHSGEFDLFLVGESHREFMVAGSGSTKTVAAEGIATAGEIVISAEMASLLPLKARGPARQSGFLLRTPSPAPPEVIQHRPDGGEADLSRFVPTAIRRHLREGGNENEHRTATVAFLHFDGTDELISEVGGNEVARRLDEVVRAAQRAADSYEVTFLGTDIDKNGGKVILTSGVPRRAGDDEQRLLLAVRQIVEQDLPLHLRVGINTGPVFAGDIGTEFRRTFTVMGDTVNLAARLMARAEPNQILATKGTLDRSSVRFSTTSLEPFMVKGKKRPVQAFEVGGVERGHLSRQDRLPLIARSQEIADLRSDLLAAASGSGRAIEIVGDHGVGKSRLAQEVLAEVGTPASLTVICEPYESTTPYATFNILGKALLGADLHTSAQDLARALYEHVADRAPDLVPEISLLGTIFDLDLPDPPEVASLEPEFRRHAVATAAAHFFAEALALPRVLLVEDAHYMDSASQEVMGLLVQSISGQRGAICLTRREIDGGFVLEQAPHLRSVLLNPLTTDQAIEALVSATDDAPLLPHEVKVLAERSGGNPLFLEELLRSHRSGASFDSLPNSVEDAVVAQIDRLPARDRLLLRCASVLGSAFFLSELTNLLSSPGTSRAEDHSAPEEYATRLRSLEQFLAIDKSGFVRFRSALVRDCAYEGLPYRRRRELHKRAAETLETASDPEILSLHYFEAQLFDKAWLQSRIAADKAREKYANVESATLYERALACASRLENLEPSDMAQAWELLGDVRERAGKFGDATVAYTHARKLSNGFVEQAELALKAAWMAERLGNFASAIRWIRSGLKTLQDLNTEPARKLRAELMTWYAAVRQAQGRLKEAEHLCRQAVEESRSSANREAEAHSLSMLDLTLVLLGQPEAAVYSPLAVEICRDIGNLGREAQVLNNMGGFAYFKGEWNQAVNLYREARDLRLKTGNEVEAAICKFNIGEILSDQGHFDEARAQLHEALRVLRAARYSWGIGYATMLLGRLESRTGGFSEAHGHFETALDNFQGGDRDALQVECLKAECLVFEGRSKEASQLTSGLAEPARDGSPVGTALVDRVRGYALAQLGDREAAAVSFKASRCVAEELGAEFELVLTLDGLRRLSVLEGDGGTATDLNVRVQEICGRLGIVNLVTVPMSATS